MNASCRFRNIVRVAAVLIAVGAFSGNVFAGAGPPPVCPTPVPEIDPGSAAGAITLLVGGVLSLVEKRKSR